MTWVTISPFLRSVDLPALELLLFAREFCMPCAGALKTLGANKDAPLPVRLFEASDVILLDDRSESGARNERRLAAVVCSKDSGFEIIHGFLNRIMEALGVPVAGNWCFCMRPLSQ